MENQAVHDCTFTKVPSRVRSFEGTFEAPLRSYLRRSVTFWLKHMVQLLGRRPPAWLLPLMDGILRQVEMLTREELLWLATYVLCIKSTSGSLPHVIPLAGWTAPQPSCFFFVRKAERAVKPCRSSSNIPIR